MSETLDPITTIAGFAAVGVVIAVLATAIVLLWDWVQRMANWSDDNYWRD